MENTVIIGGGLAGLVAAIHLAERGIRPLVLEADQRWPGGRLSGGEPDVFFYGGREWSFRPDHGVHAVWGHYDNLRSVIAQFTPAKLRLSPGEEWINRWGRDVRRIEAGNAVRSRWIPAPFHYFQLLLHPQIWANITPLDFLSLPGLLASILLAVGIDPIGEERPLEQLSMREFFRGWTPNLRATFIGLGVNLLAASVDDINLGAYIAALRFYTMLRRDAWQMHYFTADSHTALIGPLVQGIQQRGGRVLLGATAVALTRAEGGWRVVFEQMPQGMTRSVYAEDVIIALNPAGAQRLLMHSAATASVANALVWPQSLRNISVRLWFSAQPREGVPGGMFTGDFLPDNFFWLHRLYDEFADWAEAGGSAIEVHLYRSDAVMEQSDTSILVQVVDEVQRAWPELRGAFIHGAVRRNSKTHTQWRVPTSQSLHVRTPWEHVYAAGDWIGYPTPSLWMERATVTAIAAANAILARRGLDTYSIHTPPPPELTVRGLSALIHGGRYLLGPLVRALARLRRAF